MNTHRLSANIVGIVAVAAIFLLAVVASKGTAATGNLYGFAEISAFAKSNVQSSWVMAQGGRGGSTTGQQKPPPPPHNTKPTDSPIRINLTEPAAIYSFALFG